MLTNFRVGDRVEEWNAARPLAVQDRDGFLKEVAERLAGLPEHLCGAHGGAAIDGTTGGRSPVTLAKSVSA